MASRRRETPFHARSGARLISVDGRAPRHGEIVRFPNLARSLRQIAEGGRDAFYKGEIARQIVDFSNKHDGMLTPDDFAEYDAQWIEPVSTHYHGYDIYELGAQTQGITALEMLNILEGFDLKSLEHNSAEYLHLMIEAKKLAFADRDAYIGDPDKVRVPGFTPDLQRVRGGAAKADLAKPGDAESVDPAFPRTAILST